MAENLGANGGSPSILGNGAKLLGTLVFPGAANILEGRILAGLAHNLAAGLAAVVLCPTVPMVAALVVFGVKMNDLNSSINNRNIWEGITKGEPETGPSAQEPKVVT